jgi:hypothetical protein
VDTSTVTDVGSGTVAGGVAIANVVGHRTKGSAAGATSGAVVDDVPFDAGVVEACVPVVVEVEVEVGGG